MPSPITPAQFQESIPANNADMCTRFSKFLNVPSLLYQLFNWMFTSTGAISTAFKAEVATYSAPTGTVIYTLTTSVGDGYLLCDGSQVSRVTYAALFTAIGTRYGAGDGSTTFTLPDGRGRSLIGAGAGAGLSNREINTKYIGEENHTMTEEELAEHTHEMTAYTSGATDGDGGYDLNQADPSATVMVESSETGESTPFNVIHPCLIGYMWVKT